MCLQLESNMTSLALDSLAKQLDSTARSLSPALAAQAAELRRAADALRTLLADVLAPMHHYTAELNVTNYTHFTLRKTGRSSSLLFIIRQQHLKKAVSTFDTHA